MSLEPQPGRLRAVPPLAGGTPWTTPPDGDQRAMRNVLGRFATGITVVTTAGTTTHGMTANSFNSVSLEPPLVLVCVGREALMHEALMSNGVFAVSVLGSEQERVARHFSSRGRPAGAAQFAEVDWAPGPASGAPLLAGALAWLECELDQVYEGGDHSIFLGRVLGLGSGTDSRALLFYGGAFHQVQHIA